MAIQLEFCNIIVPVVKIKEKLGKKVFKDKYSQNTDTTWNDGLLWRDGCMDDSMLSDLLDRWEELGFDLIQEINGQKLQKDLCVVNSNFGPSYLCNWIEYNKETNTVWYKGWREKTCELHKTSSSCRRTNRWCFKLLRNARHWENCPQILSEMMKGNQGHHLRLDKQFNPPSLF